MVASSSPSAPTPAWRSQDRGGARRGPPRGVGRLADLHEEVVARAVPLLERPYCHGLSLAPSPRRRSRAPRGARRRRSGSSNHSTRGSRANQRRWRRARRRLWATARATHVVEVGAVLDVLEQLAVADGLARGAAQPPGRAASARTSSSSPASIHAAKRAAMRRVHLGRADGQPDLGHRRRRVRGEALAEGRERPAGARSSPRARARPVARCAARPGSRPPGRARPGSA